MESKILIKRGIEANRGNVTPSGGEPLWTTDEKKLYIGDGSTPGGIAVLDSLNGVYIKESEKASANGVATLDANGLIPHDQVPPLAISYTYVVANKSDLYLLDSGEAASNGGIHRGDVGIVTSESKTYICDDETGVNESHWKEMLSPANGVSSVNGDVGPNVTLDTNDISEGSTNLYFTNARADSRVQASIDDSAIDGATSKLWSADKIFNELKLAGKVQSVNAMIGDVVITGSNAKITGYTKPASPGSLTPLDTVNVALGKLERGLEDATAGGGDVNVQSDWAVTDTGSHAFIRNKPTSVTDFDITDVGSKKIITDVERTKLNSVQSGAEVNVQADWNILDSASDAFIKNKPVIPAPFGGKFTDLTDAASYSGKSNFLVKVNTGATGLDYIDSSEIDGGTF